ncbi:uncharacterized protein PV07_10501 [Cladophialophora immunda]|uniref:Uncharacterized protein n=1 Tax=Cladophialophora immunda TaxID=569365 RepID=A0A0D1ZAS4_9EURO|nr:uncharacterized protein PV07_10501 [Cladophialophora immunda]KIW24811.1 hypothetical protein PV07_10501 [Cladophialophora immunda]
MVTAQASKLLREIESDIDDTYKRIEEDDKYYALKGRLQKLWVVLNSPENQGTCEKRENDAPGNTRRNTESRSPSRGRNLKKPGNIDLRGKAKAGPSPPRSAAPSSSPCFSSNSATSAVDLRRRKAKG